jgi:hypothetical protein
MTEDYVSFETAKLLKEKGFDEDTSVNYFVGDDKPRGCVVGEMIYHKKSESDTHLIACPTLQTAMKWLRKKKGIAIIPIISSILDNERFLWDIKIVVAKTNETYSQGWIYEEPEEAYETAIKYALENLI